MYILVTSNRFKTVLLESSEYIVRQGRVFRGVFLLAGAWLARRLVRKRNLDVPYAHLSLVMSIGSNKNVHLTTIANFRKQNPT